MSTASTSTTRVMIGPAARPARPVTSQNDDPACAPGQGGRLELERKLFQESLWPSVSAVARGESLRGPLVVELDPTSFCDMCCPECISTDVLNQSRFSRDRLLGVGGEFIEAGVRAVILIGGGEPLLHKATGELIDILGDAGVAIGLTTNGTMIDRYLDQIARHVSWTRVSVDAGSAACFARFRPHRSGRVLFDTVIANMRRLAAAKTGSLGFSYLLMARTSDAGSLLESNFGDVAAAARLAREVGCDYFEIKPMYDMAHFLVEQPPELGDLLADQLEQASNLATPGFEVISNLTLGSVVENRQYVEPKDYRQCPVAELRTLVTSSGAYICPYHRGNPAAVYGDPVTESFTAMWSGPRRQKVKTAIDPSRDCGFHCIRHDTNLTLLRMAHEDLANEVVPDYDHFV